MAKSKAENKKVETVKVVEDIKVIEPVKEDEVTLVKNDTKPIEPKNVRVVLNKDHKLHVGGNWYTFKEDKQYNVPENVKAILKKAGLLSAL